MNKVRIYQVIYKIWYYLTSVSIYFNYLLYFLCFVLFCTFTTERIFLYYLHIHFMSHFSTSLNHKQKIQFLFKKKLIFYFFLFIHQSLLTILGPCPHRCSRTAVFSGLILSDSLFSLKKKLERIATWIKNFYFLYHKINFK